MRHLDAVKRSSIRFVSFSAVASMRPPSVGGCTDTHSLPA